ncbi:MAG TPA: hypothetical protein VE977_03280, partial [Pyrinomonadaceae bacterium]|nr:hypothetical protein [Pyrinomonadaceae bacterium]
LVLGSLKTYSLAFVINLADVALNKYLNLCYINLTISNDPSAVDSRSLLPRNCAICMSRFVLVFGYSKNLT